MNIDKDKQLTNFVFPFNSIYTPVIPCVLDGNLSFLETVWKIMYDINKVVDAVNSNHDDILQLANEINNLINDKLSVLWVEVDTNVKPVKANKTFSEITTATKNGVVLLKYVDNVKQNHFCILNYINSFGCSFNYFNETFETVIYINSDETVTITSTAYITENGGTITGRTVFTNDVLFQKSISVPSVTTTSPRTYATNIEYVGNVAAEVLKNAKTYADTQDATVTTNAHNYTDTICAKVLKDAKDYADTGDTNTLAAAKTYADTQDITTLATAKRYSDNHFSHITLTKNEDGTFSTDLAFSVIYLNITRGVLCDVRYVPEIERNTVNVLSLSTYNSSNIVFVGVIDANTTHVCTISNDGTVTYA